MAIIDTLPMTRRLRIRYRHISAHMPASLSAWHVLLIFLFFPHVMADVSENRCSLGPVRFAGLLLPKRIGSWVGFCLRIFLLPAALFFLLHTKLKVGLLTLIFSHKACFGFVAGLCAEKGKVAKYIVSASNFLQFAVIYDSSDAYRQVIPTKYFPNKVDKLSAIQANDDEHWDNFVAEQNVDSIFHYTEMLDMCGQPREYRYVIQSDDGAAQAIDILPSRQTVGLKYAGMLLRSPSDFAKQTAFNEYESRVTQMLSRLRVTKLRRKCSEVLYQTPNLIELRVQGIAVDIRQNWLLNLQENLEPAEFEGRVRTEVKKARQAGLKTHLLSLHELKKKGALWRRIKSIEAFSTYFHLKDSKYLDVYFSWTELAEQVVSGCIFVAAKEGSVVYYLNAYHSADGRNYNGSQSLNLTNALMTFKYRFKKFDFLGSRDPAISKFFRSFGAVHTPKLEITYG